MWGRDGRGLTETRAPLPSHQNVAAGEDAVKAAVAHSDGIVLLVEVRGPGEALLPGLLLTLYLSAPHWQALAKHGGHRRVAQYICGALQVRC